MSKPAYRDYIIRSFAIYANPPAFPSVAEAQDIEAVKKTIEQLNNTDRAYIVNAITEVYMVKRKSDRCLSKNKNIVLRIQWYCTNHYITLRNVYKWIEVAVKMTAENRGLAI